MGILIRQRNNDEWFVDLREKWRVEMDDKEYLLAYLINNKIPFAISYKQNHIEVEFKNVYLQTTKEKVKQLANDLINLKMRFGQLKSNRQDNCIETY